MPLGHIPGVRSLALTDLRRGVGLLEQELATLLGVSSWLVNHYENAKEPSFELLVAWGGRMGYTEEQVEWTVFGLSQMKRAAPGPGSLVEPAPALMHRVRAVAGRAARAFFEILDRSLTRVARDWLVRKARREAEKLWAELERTPPDLRRAVVLASRRFHTWALAERLAYASAKAAADRADRALELAQLSLLVAELCPGDAASLSALRGFSRGYLGNARRVANQILRAGEDFDRALAEWQAGSPAMRQVLPAWHLKDLEGSLRRDQRRFPEALARLAEAQAAAPPEAIARIMVNRAAVFEYMWDPQGAIEVLQEAIPLAAAGRRDEPRLPWSIHMNLGVNLCHLARYDEAERLLPTIQQLFGYPRRELDEIRVVWLRGRIWAGLGRVADAREAFDRARQAYEKHNLALNYAVVTLERALLDLQAGRHDEVKALAREMQWIFEAAGLQPEALAALDLFREAAEQERASRELAEQMVRYLYRVQYDPELKFEAVEPGRAGSNGLGEPGSV